MSAPIFQGVRAVLFDLDGTLIDSAPDLGAAADKLRTGRGLSSLPEDAYRPMVGAGARGMLSVAFGMTPEHSDFPALREEFFSNYASCLLNRTCLFDGVDALIARLIDANLGWGIVTNKATRFTQPLVDGIPVLQTARTVISGDTTAHAKPHPAPLLEAAMRMDIAPEHCLYVGDDERDIVAGKAAGMPTVAAMYGYLGMQKASACEWNPNAAINSPLELLQLIYMP